MATAPTPRKIIVGMSGGVDSAVSAHLLIEQGHSVEGLFMFNWAEDEDAYCTAADDFQDARRVCETLGIPLHRADFSDDYRDRVFEYFLTEYAAGRTPNPDVLCNREIKFGVFLEYATRLGADAIATGHYARVGRCESGPLLLKGRDTNKDQSYFLHAIERRALDRVRFPLGELTKDQVRDIAWQRGLHNHARKDSTGICFIGERPFAQFLSNYLPARPGPIVTAQGVAVGRHQGLMYYTLGQRQGLGLGGRRDGDGTPWYVVDKDLPNNTLVVAQGHSHPRLFSDRMWTSDVHWLADVPGARFDCQVKTRYRQQDQPCRVCIGADGTADVRFQTQQRAVTPGQYAVFYAGDVCLGGAVIARTETEHAASAAHAAQP